MPISLPSLNRRDFLKASLGAAAGGLLAPSVFAASENANPHRFALLSDVHIPANASITARGVNMTENLRRVGGELLELTDKPAAAFVSGDCAYLRGKTADYANLVGLLEPVRKSGMPIHLALGNHDNRQRFRKALSPQDAEQNTGIDRHVTIIESPRANWILLDSLIRTNYTPGKLGDAQRDWLAATLDERKDRPAILMLHHNLRAGEKTNALTDTEALMDIIVPRKHVKAVIFGHTHNWTMWQQEGIHLINMPPVAYVFVKAFPNGWVDAHLEEDGLNLQLNCLDRNHRQHGEKKQLKWRAG